MKTEQLGAYYYDNPASSYWLQIKPDKFIELKDRVLIKHMRFHKMYVDQENEFGLKDGDYMLIECQKKRGIDYAGPLAGHGTGLLRVGPKKVLVTSETQPVEARKGNCDNIDRFFEELLPDEQSNFFYGWLKIARESLLDGDFKPGPMLVFAGASGCGKSFAQTLITEFLGGRMAKPYRYMTGGTQFNSDLAAAEHLVIADEQASVDIRSRRNFGAAVKDLTVNVEMSVHAKGREAITLPTFRRVSLSCNDEAENLMILPPLDDSILDKVMLFKCSPARVGKNRIKTWKLFTSELPALAFKLEQFRIPPKLQDDRYGIKAYHNFELLSVVADLAPEQRLLSLVDAVVFKNRQIKEWEGTAIELEKSLRDSPFGFAVEKLLSFSSACAVYLQRIALKNPDRIQQSKNAGKTYWLIKKG